MFFFLVGSMISIADMNEVYADLARPGGWNGWLMAAELDKTKI